MKWGRVHNLTGLRDERDIIIRHFLDSLLFLRAIPHSAGTIADIGSGGGFPGIPLMIARPDLRVVLVEPSEKKGAFLRHIRSLLRLDRLEIITARIEDVRELIVDAAVTRALFSAGEFVRKAASLLKPDGVLILSKGPRFREELEEIRQIPHSVEDVELPFERSVRHLITIRPQNG